MRHLTLVLAILLPVILIAGVSPAAAPSPQIAQLKAQLRVAQSHASDLQDEVDAQDAVLSDQADTIQRLRTRLANQPDPLDVITARNPDGLWSAMTAIWRAFPTLGDASLCGYDRSSTSPIGSTDGNGLALTSFSFYRFGGC